MTLWIILAALTVAVVAVNAWPLLAAKPAPAGDAEADRNVYRDQLDEIDRDERRGLIGAAEAKAARNEVARRLIATEATPAAAAATPRVALAVLALVPFIALPIYLSYGAPHLPAMPLQARLDRAVENNDIFALVARVEQQLAKNPGDAQGWAVIAPVYRRMNRYADAANAYAQLLRLEPATAERLTEFGEMHTLANDGMVTATAAKSFAAALSIDAKNPKARFYSALALKQEGKREEAVKQWQALLADSRPDAPWVAMVEQQVAEASGQSEMIRNMVNGLEERLKSDNQDLDGWLKLIRSRTVLGETERARTAYAEARNVFKDKPEAIAALGDLAKELRIE
jgi:cytochrome c-type biogenesis protein CcmH